MDSLIRVAGALLLFLAPGYLLARAARQTPQPLEAIPIAFGASFALLTVLTLPFFVLQGTLTTFIWTWAAATAVLAAIAARQREAWLEPVDRRWLLAGIAAAGVIGVLGVALSRAGAAIGGEEEIEIIIARKLLEGDRFDIRRINYLEGLAPTYLLPPFYVFRAWLSRLTGVDPVLLHYRLAFLSPLLAALGFAAIVGELRRDRREGFAALVAALCLIAAWPAGASLPPFTFGVGQAFSFFRGVFTVQVLHLLWILVLFRALRCQDVFHTAMASVLIAATLFVHGIDALYCLMALPIVAAGVLLTGGQRPTAIRQTVIVTVVAALGVAVVILYRVAYAHYHPSEQSIATLQRSAVLAALREWPQHGWLTLPPPASVYAYFNERGTAFTHVQSLFVARVTPVLGLAFATVPLVILSAREAWQAWIAASLAIAPLLLRIPILLLPLLLVNTSFFTNFFYFLTLPLMLALWCVAVFAAQAAVAGLRGRTAGVVAVVGVLAAAYLLPPVGRAVAAWVHTHADVAIAVFSAANALALVARVARGPIALPRARAAALILGAAVFAIAAWSAYPGTGAPVVASAFASRPALSGYAAFVEHYAAMHDRQTRLDSGLHRALVAIRERVPPDQVFAADPVVIRAIPFAANQFIAHSGAPFDFVEAYFTRYYRSLVIDGRRQVIAVHPLFRDDRSLAPEALEEAAGFLRDFRIDYVLVTPPFQTYTREVFARLGARGWAFPFVYEADGYSVHRVALANGPAGI